MIDISSNEDKKDLVKDVVCGMVKPKDEMPFRSEYNGKIYYFCSEGDKKIFDSNPEHWIPREEEEEVNK